MKIKKIVYLIIALLMPILYHGLSKLWYYLWFTNNLVDVLPNGLRTYLLTNSFSFDAIFCGLLILLCLPYYLWRRKDISYNIPSEYVRTFDVNNLLPTVLITFGAGGLTAICQLVIRTVLANVDLVSDSVKTFDSTFATATSSHMYLWTFLSVALLGPIIEEIIFRGVLFTELNRYFSGTMVVFITSIYFGLWHSNPIQMVYTMILGVILGLSYVATRNMWFPLMIHLLNNMLSTLPPFLENNEMFMLIMLVTKFVAIIPMAIILYKMLKNNSSVNWKLNNN